MEIIFAYLALGAKLSFWPMAYAIWRHEKRILRLEAKVFGAESIQ